MLDVKFVVANMTQLAMNKIMNAFAIVIKKKGNVNGSVIIYQVRYRKR